MMQAIMWKVALTLVLVGKVRGQRRVVETLDPVDFPTKDLSGGPLFDRALKNGWWFTSKGRIWTDFTAYGAQTIKIGIRLSSPTDRPSFQVLWSGKVLATVAVTTPLPDAYEFLIPANLDSGFQRIDIVNQRDEALVVQFVEVASRGLSVFGSDLAIVERMDPGDFQNKTGGKYYSTFGVRSWDTAFRGTGYKFSSFGSIRTGYSAYEAKTLSISAYGEPYGDEWPTMLVYWGYKWGRRLLMVQTVNSSSEVVYTVPIPRRVSTGLFQIEIENLNDIKSYGIYLGDMNLNINYVQITSGS